MNDPLSELHHLIFSKNYSRVLHLIDVFGVSDQGRILRKHFARFLGAYYLDLPLFIRPIQNNLDGFPKLAEWKQEIEEDESTVLWLDRTTVAKSLPSRCSPKFAVILFLEAGTYAEAVGFLSHFCDIRSNLLLRLAASEIEGDSQESLSVAAYLESKFKKPWCYTLDRLDSAEDANHLRAVIKSALPLFTFLDAEVGMNFLLDMQHHFVAMMHEKASRLSLTVPSSVSLPRVPIFFPQDNETNQNMQEESENLLQIAVIIQILLDILVVRSCFFQAESQLLADILKKLRGICSENRKYNRISQRILNLINWDFFKRGAERTECRSLSTLSSIYQVAIFLQVRDRFSVALRDYWSSGNFESGSDAFNSVRNEAAYLMMFLVTDKRQELENLLQHNFTDDKNHITMENFDFTDFLVEAPEEVEKTFFFAMEHNHDKYGNEHPSAHRLLSDCACSTGNIQNLQSKKCTMQIFRSIDHCFPNHNLEQLPNTIPLMIHLTSNDIEPFLQSQPTDSPSFGDGSSGANNERLFEEPGLNKTEIDATVGKDPGDIKLNASDPMPANASQTNNSSQNSSRPIEIVSDDDATARANTAPNFQGALPSDENLNQVKNHSGGHSNRPSDEDARLFSEMRPTAPSRSRKPITELSLTSKDNPAFQQFRPTAPDVPSLEGLTDCASPHSHPPHRPVLSMKHLSLSSATSFHPTESESGDELSEQSISEILKNKLGLEKPRKALNYLNAPTGSPSDKLSTSDDKSTDSDVESLPFDEPPKTKLKLIRHRKPKVQSISDEEILSPARLKYKKRKKLRMESREEVTPPNDRDRDIQKLKSDEIPKLNFQLLNLDVISELNGSKHNDKLSDFKLISLPNSKPEQVSSKKIDIIKMDQSSQTERLDQVSDDTASEQYDNNQVSGNRSDKSFLNVFVPLQKLSSDSKWTYLHQETIHGSGIMSFKTKTMSSVY